MEYNAVQEPSTTDQLESELVASAVEALPEEPEVARGDLVQPGPGVQAPTVVKRPQPRYPDAARRLGRTAVVVLRLLIDEDGKVAEIQQSDGLSTGRRSEVASEAFDRAFLAGAQGGLFVLDVRHQVGHGFFHPARDFNHLGQEHLDRAKEIADDVHAVH